MLYLELTDRNGQVQQYRAAQIPVSQEELTRQLRLYYRGRDCERCKRAIIDNGFARLITELDDDGEPSGETKALFPVTAQALSMTIKEM